MYNADLTPADFSKIEALSDKKFYLQGEKVVGIYSEMKKVLKGEWLLYSTIKIEISRFQTNFFKKTNEPCLG